jgi:hypothetical protein
MYLIDGRRWTGQEPDFDDALSAAHEQRNRPICLCSGPGIETYIARLAVGRIVKRLPYTGSEHAPDCPHFEPPADASGLGQVMGSAIREDIDSGVTLLKLGFAMSKGGSRAVCSGSDDPKGSVATDGVKLSLRGLLHFLWDQAELTHWRPGFAGKRTWAIVRSHLLAAALNKTARGSPLSLSIYVPEVFSVERREEINARRIARFLRGSVSAPGARRPLVLMIAELKEISPARFGFKALIKHAPDQAFALDRQLHRRLSSRFAAELSMWGACDSIHMMVIATFGINGAGVPTLEELSLMPVTAQWIPIDDIYDQQLVVRLVRDGRAFVKLLNYDAPMSASRKSAMLLDAGSSAIPLRVQRPRDARREDPGDDVCSNLAETNLWVWNVDQEDLPALPSRRMEHRVGVASVDARITQSQSRT